MLNKLSRLLHSWVFSVVVGLGYLAFWWVFPIGTFITGLVTLVLLIGYAWYVGRAKRLQKNSDH